MAAHVDIQQDWFTGEDKVIDFLVRQHQSVEPQDITGWSISWIVKRRRSDTDATALIRKTTGSGIVLTTPTGGVCTVTVTDTDIQNLRAEVRNWHELKRTDAGFETVLSHGSFTLEQSAHE